MTKATWPLVIIWGGLAIVAAFSLSPVHVVSGSVAVEYAALGRNTGFSSLGWGMTGAFFGGFCAYASRTALFFRCLREDEGLASLVSARSVKKYSLWALLPRTLVLVGVVGGLSAVLFAAGSALSEFFLYLAFPMSAFLGVFLAQWSVSRWAFSVSAPSNRSLWPYLILDTALPSGVLTAFFSCGFAALRIVSFEEVHAIFAAKHLALTIILYGVAVGLSGFVKVMSEVKSGAVVVVASVPKKIPGSVALAGVMALFVLVFGPRFLPNMSLTAFLGLKAALGFFTGGGIAGLGGMRALSVLEHGAPKSR